MKLPSKKKQLFVGFVVGGDGGIDYCTSCCLQLLEGGVDILEIGLPFSDPVADGEVIQSAAARSLQKGTNPAAILEIARRIRKKSDAPLVLFSYYNPLLRMGLSYLKEVKNAGFDAVLVVDLAPSEENLFFFEEVAKAGLCPIFLIAPSTDEKRIAQIAKRARGFLYYACQKGTTGMRDSLPEDFATNINTIRKHSSLPIVAGFGIANRQTARSALALADGFVVGSAFVKKMEEGADACNFKMYAQSIDPRNA